ncbi:ferritin-like fold-containing protein [Cellulomonas endophytica]|uniref:ferritin-like fold-containing protein n=1 Tax=Cellulomonas endophytica TaxID=2494735 RepID=UPI001010CC66|nr:ferritin-like fold-containing protein [Cellulomonas endophytica]
MTLTPRSHRRTDVGTDGAEDAGAAVVGAAADGADAGVGADAATRARDAVDLLGLVAQLEHQSFARLAADAAVAPTLEQRLQLSRFAVEAVERRDRVLNRVVELGASPVEAMRPYEHLLDDFDARTEPSSWWERLLKAYVGYGVADDFCRLVATGIDERSRDLVLEVLEDASHAELAVAELDAAGADDDVLTARLALWGRRLVGEALGTVQRLVVQHPGLARLIAERPVPRPAAAGPGAAGTPADPRPTAGAPTAPGGTTEIFGELTAEHTRRMSRLGLTA